MAINKNSNKYTIIYTIVMVVIVGALLAFLATSLKDRQAENVLNEQKNSIMKAFGAEDGDFDKDVKVFCLDTETGESVEQKESSDIEKVFSLISNRKELAAADNNLPYFTYEREVEHEDQKVKETLYVMPLVGKGLWGDIWGYVSLKNGNNGWEVTGIVMDHAGETPGLGAEIATEKVQKQFEGMRLFDGDTFALKMLKNGKDNKEYIEGCSVDAISGGTKTCDGVNLMLENSLVKYEALFNAVEVDAPETDVEGIEESVDNVDNVDDTEESEEPVADVEESEELATDNVELKSEEE